MASGPARGGPAALTEEERAKRLRHDEAMRRGRAATAAKQYQEAITAFTAALSAQESEPRALAERGYARLLEGTSLDAAARDLDDAASRTRDPKLLAQIWFNRGLIEEKQGDEDNALSAFQRADKLAPSAAAKRKIAGRSGCGVQVERGKVLGLQDRSRFEAPDWPALVKLLSQGVEGEQPEAPAKLPAIVVIGQAGAGRTAFVVASHQGKLKAVAVGVDVGGRCPGELDFEVVSELGALLHVRGSELPEGGYGMMCKASGGEVGPCGEPAFAEGEPVQSYCAGGTATERDVVVDLAKGEVLVTVERPMPSDDAVASAPRIVATLEDAGLRLRSAQATSQGCSAVVALTR